MPITNLFIKAMLCDIDIKIQMFTFQPYILKGGLVWIQMEMKQTLVLMRLFMQVGMMNYAMNKMIRVCHLNVPSIER